MSTRRGQLKEEDSDKLPVLGEDGRESAGGYYNNNHVRNKPTGYRAFPSSSRPGSGSRRTPTPTKQIALQAVRRKDDVVKEPFDDVDLAELNSTLKLESEKSFLERENSNTDLKKGDGASGFTVKLPNGYGSGAKPKDSPSKTSNHDKDISWENEMTRSVPNSKVGQKTPDRKSSKAKDSGNTEDSSDDDDDDDEDEDDPASWQEGDNKTAPMQLMMEFIGCLMQGDYPNAAKLCKMILMYEPTNAEALKFQPLINEKIELDAQPDVDSGSGESGSEEEEDEGNSDDDSDSDDSDESDDDSDASDDSSSEAENEGEKADSGISSGLSGSNSNSEME